MSVSESKHCFCPLRCRVLPALSSKIPLRYDVWLANRRGNKYSHKHLQLKSNSDAYWDFSFDQTALLDVPCLVEYVLKETGYSNLTYLGFSQGNAEGMAALSLSRSLNDRINLLISLAPMTKPKGNALFVPSTIHSYELPSP